MFCLLHLACSAISDVVKGSLSIISRIRANFEGESLKATPPGLITVKQRVVVQEVADLIVRQERGAGFA